MSKVIDMRMTGDFKKTEGFLHKIVQFHYRNKLDHYGELGVQALRAATPKDTGKTADSWRYEIVDNGERLAIYWCNDNRSDGGALVSILLQYGHSTRTGGWVEGIDYINPTLKPLFDRMAKEAWKEVIG